MWGRHPASRGMEDVAPYQSDGADLMSGDEREDSGLKQLD